MPKIHVSKSVQIGAPVERVFSVVRDFKQWQPWSPWVVAEPECKMKYGADGDGYAWDGMIIGSGKMEVVSEEFGRSIDQDLNFIKPWKSYARTGFEFEEKEGGTKVTWRMDSSLPFFMFFMKGMMEAFIGMDYQRGLAMLKDYVETGEVPSKSEFPGRETYAGCSYVGIERECSMDEMPRLMGEDFGKLKEWLAGSGVKVVGKALSIYHKWDVVRRVSKYTIGCPVEGSCVLPEGFVEGQIPAGEVYVVKHLGRYAHLGNAWSAGYMHSRAKKFKMSKKVMPFETYENEPDEVGNEKDLMTVIRFPIK